MHQNEHCLRGSFHDITPGQVTDSRRGISLDASWWQHSFGTLIILRLRSYVDDLSIQSISMPPEQMMRVEEEMRFRRTTTRDG